MKGKSPKPLDDEVVGSQGGTRTRTEESPTDFKSVASAISPLGHISKIDYAFNLTSFLLDSQQHLKRLMVLCTSLFNSSCLRKREKQQHYCTTPSKNGGLEGSRTPVLNNLHPNVYMLRFIWIKFRSKSTNLLI